MGTVLHWTRMTVLAAVEGTGQQKERAKAKKGKENKETRDISLTDEEDVLL